MIVCIDPGHGGTDPGGCSNGLREKDLTLDISLKLNNLFLLYLIMHLMVFLSVFLIYQVALHVEIMKKKL